MDDDWFDSEAQQHDIERNLAEKENQLMEERFQKEGYREGLIRITEEQEQIIKLTSYQKGFEDAKKQFKTLQFIELVLANEKLFESSLVAECQKKKNSS